MIIAKIKQSGQVITLEDKLTTFRYSANLQMQFVKDDRYKDYVLIGWYRHLRKEEYLLDIDKDGIFTLGKDIFKQRGTVEFSFSLNNPANGEIIHLGVIEYVIEQSFGSGDAILPEEQDTWIQVVSRVVEDQVSDIWDKDYKPQLEQNLQIIEAKTEEIKTAAMEVKQDALESSVNAKSALDSANLAQSSANTALEAEEKALEHSTNAEKFKNDAFSYANQANLAKTEAQKSATDANSSASSALTNANKAKEHLDNVIEKVNAFNVDYTEKVNNFNSNVESANTALDAKIEKANTDIDKKVLDANTNLDKKIADANTSIDGKVTVATEQANIATSKATELSQAVDKVKHLEDVVDTKLTQPYVSSSIIENDTISDSDEGQLRNLKIYGKCTQKVETDIVPTPSRPVPITSKKIVVGGEVVELRSLKESVNLWDSRLMNYRVGNDLEAQAWGKALADVSLLNLKPNTTYTCTCKIEMLENVKEGLTPFDLSKRVMLYRIGSNDYGLPAYSGFIIYDRNEMQNGDIVENKYTFTTPNDLRGLELLIYTERYLDANNKAYFSKVAFRDIVLVEGTTVPNTYVASTVRDYKVVDHTNKKAWIERNVGTITVSKPTKYNEGFYFYTIDMKIVTNYKYALINCLRIGILNQKNCAVFGMNSKYVYCFPDWCNQGMTIDEIKTNLAEKPILLYYPLGTPVTEEIPYLENDQSEFGISSQDSTSPSPNIESPIETVTELNIKACGKNLLNEELLKNPDNYIKNETNLGFWKFKVLVPKSVSITVSRKDTTNLQSYLMADYSGSWNNRIENKWLSHETSGYRNCVTLSAKNNKGEVYLYFSAVFNKIELLLELVGYLQVEVGDTATKYEPYQENGFYYELANPLLSLADGSVADIITLENRLNLLSIYTFTGNETFSGSYGEQKGYYGRYFMISNARGSISQKVFCNVLPHVPSSWSLGQEGCCQNANQLHLKFSNLRLGIKDDTPVSEKMVAFRNYIKELYNNGTPIEFLYILENPTTEPLEPELIEKLKTLKTFYPITHIISNVPLEFAYKLNMPAWHKVVSGQVENAKDVIYNLTVKQNNLEVMQLQSALETQYNMDLLKLGGNLC